MCVGLSVYMHHVCAMPIEVRGNIVFLELEFRCCESTMWVLGTEQQY